VTEGSARAISHGPTFERLASQPSAGVDASVSGAVAAVAGGGRFECRRTCASLATTAHTPDLVSSARGRSNCTGAPRTPWFDCRRAAWWSDIVPGASYEEPALRPAAVRVVQELDLSDLTLAGESMGATLAQQ
jgi:hypothetical protein